MDAKPKFTPHQQAAIDCDAPNILVSAAAGSGKTAVLTERIMRHVKNGVDIDKLLVVTFTESAAAEMRERITDKLQNFDPRQATLLATADISTIHAFCKKLVKENFQALDIDPAFRVGDAGELSLIRAQVMNQLFEAEYEWENNDDFLDLADVYGGKTMDGRLDALVQKIHDFMESDPFPQQAAKRYSAAFDVHSGDLDDTPWADIVRQELALGLDGVLEGLKQAISICNTADGPQKYIETLEADLAEIQKLRVVVDGGKFAEIYDAFLQVEWGRLPAIGAKDLVNPDSKSRVQRIRDKAVKDKIKSLTKGVFFAPPEKMQSDLTALHPRVTALLELAMRFSEAYSEEKRARNILDFTDLEHFAIKVLYPHGPEDLTPSPHIQKYHEVLIDEYQDSNAVQDMILSAVAYHRFMVGDVKQSIYRFRRANPGLFRDKYRTYTPHENGGSENTLINLSHNFRSRPEVLNAVNFFFSQLVCGQVGEVDYNHQAALHPGREEYPPPEIPNQMRVELLDQAQEQTELEDDTEDTPSNIIAETRMIAKCINDLLETRDCKPGDIAILTRGLSGMAGEVIEELKRHGIDATADIDAGFFDQIEVKTALAFLRITDNPLQDIELITALHSPVYGLTPDELLEIRQHPGHDEHAMLYDRVLAFATQESAMADKVKTFLAHLEGWRAAANYLPVSRLIGLIYDTTQYPAHVLAAPGGLVRQANLRLLLERAIEFEETSLKGLFHFINYMERLRECGGDFTTAAESPSDQSNRVRIMTIHKSKGLEFPIVICAFLGKKFNTDSEKQPVILHSEMGLGPYYVDTTLRTRANTLARFSLARLTRRESLSEELRCLYVAMTRAKELLILTARCQNLQKSIEKWADHRGQQNTNLPVYYRRTVTSYLDWLMPCLLRHCHGEFLAQGDEAVPPDHVFNHPADFKITIHAPDSTVLEKSAGKNTSQVPPMAILAPLALAEGIPSKLSISEIKRLYDITPDSTLHEDMPPNFDPPAFIRTETGPTAMQLGSALHTIAEHMNYRTHTTDAAIEELIQSLAAKNLLAAEIVPFIDREKVKTLANSPLADRIRKAQHLHRETPFVLAIPAHEIYPTKTPTEENILVHGIIDCYFQEDDKIILLDFKSDANPEAHLVQMQIYKKAVEQATGLEVKEILIYSFALGMACAL